MTRFKSEISFIATIIGTGLSMEAYLAQKALDKTKKEMSDKITQLTTDLTNAQIDNVTTISSIQAQMIELKEKALKAQELVKNLNKETNVNSESFDVLRSKAQSEFNKIIDIVDEITKNINGRSKNFSSGDIYSYFSSFQDYLATLTLEQTFCLVHLFAFSGILICLFNLASVFYSESLINFYDLETKFPKLAKFIKFRGKFQQYYFAWNLLLIVTILAVLIYFNLKVFLL